MQEIKKVFSYAKEHKRKIYYAIILATLSVLIGIMPYYFVYRMVIEFLQPQLVTSSFILQNVLLIFGCFLLKSLLFFNAMRFSHHAAFDTLLGMRSNMAEKLIKMPMGEISKKGSGEYKQIFVDLIEDMESIIAHLIPEGISNTVVPIAVVIFLFAVSWRMALLTLAVIPIALIFFKIMMRGRLKKLQGFLASSQKMNNNIVEFIGGMEVIKIFNQTTSSFKKYTSSVQDYKDFTLGWSRDSWPSLTAFYVILPCTVLFSLPLGALFILQGTLSIQAYILCMLLSLSLGTPLLRLTEFGTNFQLVTQKSRIIDEILTKKELLTTTNPIKPNNYNVKFSNVSFAYDQQEVIKGISFEAKENTVTALVGKSGSGKSTLAKLLVRFWDVKNGEISIGSVSIKDMSFKMLMDCVSYVSQDIHLFNTSIIENIRMGKPSASDAEVVKVAKLAECHNFIMQMEQGYNSNIGDSGAKLSGGQRQRISIARALLKDSPIIVLDEATAFTDPENEDKIQRALNGLINGKTLIVIAHKLSTIVEADNIILVNEGTIAKQGTHKELLKDSELYQLMWSSHCESLNWDIRVKEEA